MTGTDGGPPGERVHAETREQWRAWLAEHAGQSPGAWLVSWRQQTGRPAVGYEAAVCEALAVGWVDSKQVRLDEDRTLLWFTPRRLGSGWSRPNKVRLAALEQAGLMTPAGRRAVERAVADGSWTLLDDVEDLVVPADLADALAARPGATEHWEALTRSAKRAALEHVVRAKRPETRVRRVEQVADAAAAGRRPI